jgi:hypothetical protein
MIRRLLRAALSRGIETTLAIVVVLVFFLAFMAILFLSFPRGVGLGTLLREKGGGGLPGASAVRRPPSVGGDWKAMVALLARVDRTVKSKPADSIVWSDAPAGLKLEDQDAVQTFSRSHATISFDETDRLEMDENSLVVIRHFEREEATGKKRASVVLIGGELRGTAGGAGANSTAMEIVAGRGTVVLGAPGHGTTDFKVTTGADSTSVVQILSGAAEVVAGGRRVSVGANQAITVSPEGSLRGPVRLPSAPSLDEPRDGGLLTSRLLPADVALSWQAGDADRWRVLVARDAGFQDVVLDRRTETPAFPAARLAAGRYHWKACATVGAVDGLFSGARRFDVAQDNEPPALDVDFPEGPVASGPLALRGAAEPGARVFIGKAAIPADASGTFEWSVDLVDGINVVVVEAVDAAGNIAYRSRRIAAR